MSGVKTAFVFLLSFALSACRSGDVYTNTYRAGVILKEVSTEAHKSQWSDPLRARAAACDTEVTQKKREDPNLDAEAALDGCLDPYDREANDKVKAAFAVYKTAAEALTAILIAAEKNPNGLDEQALTDAFAQTLSAARDLIALFPKSKEWADRLDMLLKGLVK